MNEQQIFIEEHFFSGQMISPFEEFQELPFLDQCLILAILKDVPRKEVHQYLKIPQVELADKWHIYYPKWRYIKSLF